MTVIGGATVGELQRRMSHAEFVRWCIYRRQFGPMNYERRYDRPAALLAYKYSQVHGGNPESIADFMPWSQDESVATLEEIAKELGI